jgi:iron complex transport system permease protein
MTGRRRIAFFIVAASVLLLIALQLTVGVVWVPLREVLAALMGADVDRVTWARIVTDYRWPRMLTALFAGSALGVCGLLLQTLFRNPLADPWFLGLVHGSRLGVAILVVLGGGVASANALAGLGLLNSLGLIVFGALGAGALAALLSAMARRVSPVTLLVSGVMLGQACIGMISVVLHFTDDTQARVFEAWDDGAFTQVTGIRLMTLIVVMGVVTAASMARSKSLNAFLLGDNYARSMGVSVGAERAWLLALAAGLAGAVTAFCGPIVFLGLLAPHVARAIFRTSDHRVLLPAVTLTGAALASVADLFTHLPWSRHVFHLNAVNGLIGAPFVLWMLFRQRGGRLLEG